MPVTNEKLFWPKMRKLLRAPKIGFNAEVQAYFKDENGSDESLSVSRKALRDLCLIGSKDSKITAEYKIRYFREFIQKVHLKPEIYGTPTLTLQETMEFYPQVQLHFKESLSDAKEKVRERLRSSVSFRILDENLSLSDAKILANKIKSIFATPVFSYRRGEELYNYIEQRKGYYFKIYALNESEAKKIIERTMQIRNDNPDWDKLTVNTSSRNWKAEKKKTLLGKQQKLPNKRPTGTVYFTHAELKTWGRQKDLILADLGGVFPNVL